MAVDVLIPTLGESITEAVIVKWAKADGDAVATDDLLLELETEKASVEIRAEQAGVLQLVRREGETVQVGDVVARITESDGRATKKSPAAVAAPTSAPASPAAPSTAPLSPAVARLVREHDIDPATVPGSGPKGRLTKGDVLAHLEKPAPAPATRPAASKDGEDIVALTPLRRRIADRLVQAQHTAAILTTFNEIDMTGVLALRARYKERFKERHGVGLGFMSFFARACVTALHEIPAVNAEIRGTDVVYKRYVNLGVAVGSERGLVVPVVPHAEQRTFAELEKEIERLAGLARSGKLSIDDLSGGTFTISNGGVYGSLMSTPILNPPQSGILGMHKIEKRPVVVDDQIVIRPMMYVALSYDHRLVDGEQAVTFLVRVKERIEDPSRLLLEV
ncbi:MAG: 2-oxoglutarate dehydrogenase complex dihydrolipoyllysine-residue succinyltransferase [Deltaproteobacteria bacterium]|nr:2-oxoglutarate dehydrogenase complex dihydrolipoyllysine-residue succinyltransferase [Deltaproteobacteria bacterium]MBI3390845.1 2-oxoglutarate dehydrogenase complex dihydrolipoyllysine-residue succinyltransferase [Deltaproteobacteria bacterium]